VENLTSPTTYNFSVTLIDTVRYIRFSHSVSQPTSVLKMLGVSNKDVVTSEVFTTPEHVGRRITEVKEELGLNIVPAGTNILSHLRGSDQDDPNIWGDGYFSISGSGSVASSGNWKYSKKYERAFPGEYTCLIRYSGDAALVAFDVNKSVISVIAN